MQRWPNCPICRGPRLRAVHDRGGASLNALLMRAGLPESTFAAFRAALEASHEIGFVDTLGGAARLRRRMVERVLTHCETDRQGRRAAPDPVAALRDRVRARGSAHVLRRTGRRRGGSRRLRTI